jgi:UDP-glucose 4-epimerase
MSDVASLVNGKRVLITGGLGMIGSTLAHKLVPLGAKVTLVDAFIEPFGANLFNIETIRNQVTVNIADIRDKEAMKWLVRGQDIVFNLAGQVSHNDSIENPFLDADINYFGHLNVAENLRKFNRHAVVVFSGSRLQFGRIDYNPVDEKHPLNPRTPYALHKTAAENMYRFYHEMYGIPYIAFRIANPYGPRSQMKHSKYCMINWFLRLAMEDKPITVFGDGEQVRDYIFVDDLADALLLAAITPSCHGQTFNVGSGVGAKFKEMVEIIIDTVHKGNVQSIPWPKDYVNVETGDYITDIGKLQKAIDWKPRIDLRAGIRQTFEYYQCHRAHYW